MYAHLCAAPDHSLTVRETAGFAGIPKQMQAAVQGARPVEPCVSADPVVCKSSVM